MEYRKLTPYRDYWSSHSNFSTTIVCQTMSRNTFTKILSNIHFADNTKIPPKTSSKYSKTFTVDEFPNSLMKNFKTNYNLDENVSIDESMVKFKGRSSLKQYLPLKPTKHGFKVWTLADSKNGYVYSFCIYKGKDYPRQTTLSEHVARNIVSDLRVFLQKSAF